MYSDEVDVTSLTDLDKYGKPVANHILTVCCYGFNRTLSKTMSRY